MVDVAVSNAAERPVRPDDVVNAVDVLQVHRESLEAVGNLAGHRPALEAADLLEVGELRDLHAVEPDLPAEPPRAERRRLPVVLDEADVVHSGVDADRAQRIEVQLLQVVGRRLDRHLVLVIVLQAKRVVAVAAVGRPSRRLHIGRAPGLGTDGAQERRRMKGAGTHRHVVWLHDHAAVLRPVLLQLQNQVLKTQHCGRFLLAHGVVTGFKAAQYIVGALQRGRPSGCFSPEWLAALRFSSRRETSGRPPPHASAPKWCAALTSRTNVVQNKRGPKQDHTKKQELTSRTILARNLQQIPPKARRRRAILLRSYTGGRIHEAQ